jgi:hypothetical protein
MGQAATNLGICFSSDHLFYAVSETERAKEIKYLGAVDFNFNVQQSLVSRDEDEFPAVMEAIRNLKDQHRVDRIRIQTHPSHECWSVLPKLVYDKADEREAYLNLLMRGINRRYIEPMWFGLSNQNFKLLLVRNQNVMEGYRRLTSTIGRGEYYSDFELGQCWMQHTGQKGSFLTVSIHNNIISIASFLLGNLRAATYIKFDDLTDLPYLWLQQAEHLKWLNGLHEYIYVYGEQTDQLIDVLTPYWDDASTIFVLDSLEKMQVKAPEKNYSFSLTKAFPSILMATSGN